MEDVPPLPSLTDRILARQADDKARAVLVAAFDCFLQFGVRRTAMQDIAERAGMSRAALYLHYRNKDDIFRALISGYFTAASEAASEALAAHSDPVAALLSAFAAQGGDAAARMMESPHSEELLGAKMTAARELVLEGEQRLASVYAAWLRDGVAAGRLAGDAVGEDAGATAVAMLGAVMGLKQVGLDSAGYGVARDRLAVMFGRALRP